MSIMKCYAFLNSEFELTILEKLYNQYFLLENYQDKKTFIFNEKYNSILDTCILESIQTIKLLDISVEVIIHKPIKQVHQYEFEEYFGFGGHCDGFDSNKKIISCPKNKT